MDHYKKQKGHMKTRKWNHITTQNYPNTISPSTMSIFQGLMNLEDSFLVPRIDGRELTDLFFRLRLDHPEIFWASGFHYKYYQDSPNLDFGTGVIMS